MLHMAYHKNIQKPELITASLQKDYTPEIAIKYQTTVGCVERDMPDCY